MAELNRMNPVYPETVRSNFQAIARGGLSMDYMFLTCYADYAISEYLLGPSITGTPMLTVAYDRRGEARSYELYRVAHAWGEFGDESLMSEGEYEAYLNQIAQDVDLLLSIFLEDRESVVFLAPMGAHNAIAVEAWQAVTQWDLQEDDEEVVHAVRYGVPEGDPEYTQTLANLESRITAGATTADFADDRIENASGLNQDHQRSMHSTGVLSLRTIRNQGTLPYLGAMGLGERSSTGVRRSDAYMTGSNRSMREISTPVLSVAT